jgi:hypothetical protein
MHWLGVWFDRKLSFKAHIAVMVVKAKYTAAGIRALGNTIRGAPAQLLRQAVQACVQPVLCHRIETWWPGSSRKQKGKILSNRLEGLLRKLDTVQNEALRGALPVYRTTPAAVLQREAAILPVRLALDYRATLNGSPDQAIRRSASSYKPDHKATGASCRDEAHHRGLFAWAGTLKGVRCFGR